MEWHDIPGFPYEITREGKIRHKKEFYEPKQYICSEGYYSVNLSTEGKRTVRRVHNLLGKVFLPNPDNLPVVDHINQNKLDNSLCNLRWNTKSGNALNSTQKKKTISGHKYIQISHTGNYTFRIKGYPSKTFKTLPEAIQARDEYLEEKQNI